MSPAAQAARREYLREYRSRNRERLREYKRNWNRAHPDAVKRYQREYWERKAGDPSGNGDANTQTTK